MTPCGSCVDSKRPRVCARNVTVCTGTTRTCFNTCARGAGIHGDVLNVHTEAFLKPNTGFPCFSACRNTHKHTFQTHTTTTNNTTTTTTTNYNQQQPTTTHNDTQRHTPHNTTHNITRRQRREKTKREKKQDKRRDKLKKREKMKKKGEDERENEER